MTIVADRYLAGMRHEPRPDALTRGQLLAARARPPLVLVRQAPVLVADDGTCDAPSRGRYVYGCHCPGCRAANAAYHRQRRA